VQRFYIYGTDDEENEQVETLTDTSELIRFYFLVLFPLFSFWFRAVD